MKLGNFWVCRIIYTMGNNTNLIWISKGKHYQGRLLQEQIDHYLLHTAEAIELVRNLVLFQY